MTVPLPNAPILFDLFGKVVPPQFFDELRERLGLQAQGIYTLAVVVWLMMWQRLDGRGTLAVAVQQVVQGVLGAMLPPDKRVREGRVSSNPGALCRARQRMPLEAAEAVCDEVFTKLTAAEPGEGLRSRLFLLDGSSMRTVNPPGIAPITAMVTPSSDVNVPPAPSANGFWLSSTVSSCTGAVSE